MDKIQEIYEGYGDIVQKVGMDKIVKRHCIRSLQYGICIEQFMDKCDECLAYLKNCIQVGKCTEEQKYVVNGLEDWMNTKGYQMIADTVQKMSMDDEKKALGFVEFYEFMLQCSSEDIEKLIDYLFFIPEQFMKQFNK